MSPLLLTLPSSTHIHIRTSNFYTIANHNSGVLTEICVAFPALSLIEQGYEVFVVTDASGTFAEHTREAAHKRMAAAGCQLLNWAAVAGEIHRDWRRDIEGFGAIWRDHIPGYWCLMQSYEAAQKAE